MGVEITEDYVTPKESHYTITLTDDDNDDHHTISTTVTSHPDTARNCLHSILHQHRSIRHRLIIGLAIQFTPYYHNYHHHSAATIQLCIGNRCLIFHLAHADSCPRILRRVLSDPRITIVGLWNSEDSGKLMGTRHQLEMVRGMPIDGRLHVEGDDGRGMRGSSIAEIAEEVLGFDVAWSVEVSRSDWEDEDLGLEQVRQAAVKAFVCFAVGMRISAWELNPVF